MSYYTKQEINGRMSLRHADYLCDSCHRAMYARLCNLQNVDYDSIAEDAHNKFNTLMCEVYGWPEEQLSSNGFYDTVTFLMTSGSKSGIRIKPRHMLPKMIKLAISGDYEILGKLSAEIRDIERKATKKATREKKTRHSKPSSKYVVK